MRSKKHTERHQLLMESPLACRRGMEGISKKAEGVGECKLERRTDPWVFRDLVTRTHLKKPNHMTRIIFEPMAPVFSLGVRHFSGFSLVRLTSRFEATRWLIWDGPRNFELRSYDESDTTLFKLPHHTTGRAFGLYV
ncbi:hypothetical protein AVEN_229858-1 [Araneus ventricosus]|uniref:Uncharacterized protein n=1 Tax=Araneus ventricosus TaxID=182803 RepID=A0A4Y2SFD2_ARAVE|nr:hypothetical protein AVEN_229858-1 [Araneus ventricosus]